MWPGSHLPLYQSRCLGPLLLGRQEFRVAVDAGSAPRLDYERSCQIPGEGPEPGIGRRDGPGLATVIPLTQPPSGSVRPSQVGVPPAIQGRPHVSVPTVTYRADPRKPESLPGTMFPFLVQSSWIMVRAASTVIPNWSAAKATASRNSFPTRAIASVSAYAVRRSPARYTVLPGVSKRDQAERSAVLAFRGRGFRGP
jgi:hypothetical protein